MSELETDTPSTPVYQNGEQTSNQSESSVVKAYETFDEMDLPDNLLHGIFSYGFEKPSSIQQLTIVPMKNGRDMIAQSRSGTGKTGAFTIGSLSNIDPSIPYPQVIVICPVRELAEQSYKVAQEIGKRLNIKAMFATGGSNLRGDIGNLRSGAQYIVGTPGRIYDLIRRGDLCLDYMRYLIFDEADQLLDNLFHDQILTILKFKFPKSTALALFSATMPDEVLSIAEKFLQDPVRILTPSEEWSLEGIKQYYVSVDLEEWKFDVLQDIMAKIKINQALIYVNKRHKAEWLAKKMIDAGHSLEFIHGDMDVQERKKRLSDFRMGQSRVLISTDLLARGIDVQTLSIVINFELPPSRENYLHRIGRTGRYGRKGVSLNIITKDEMGEMKNIEKEYGTTISELPSDLGVLGR